MYARSENYCIGKQGRTPWLLPDELAHFKRTTQGGAVVMGRRTYEDHQTLLSHRLNIVVTRRPEYEAAAGVLLVPSFERALEVAAAGAERVFVVGGAQLFELAFPLATSVYETVVHTEIRDGDSFVPAFDFSGWSSETLEQHAPDERHAFAYTARLHQRRK